MAVTITIAFPDRGRAGWGAPAVTVSGAPGAARPDAVAPATWLAREPAAWSAPNPELGVGSALAALGWAVALEVASDLAPGVGVAVALGRVVHAAQAAAAPPAGGPPGRGDTADDTGRRDRGDEGNEDGVVRLSTAGPCGAWRQERVA